MKETQLQRARKKRGFKLREASLMSGISEGLLSKYERGLVRIPENRVPVIAKIWGVTENAVNVDNNSRYDSSNTNCIALENTTFDDLAQIIRDQQKTIHKQAEIISELTNMLKNYD